MSEPDSSRAEDGQTHLFGGRGEEEETGGGGERGGEGEGNRE